MTYPIEQGFLPVTRADMDCLGWDAPDFLLVTGDAYVDHPSFGHAIISRVLTAAGYRVAILAQPDWRNPDDFKRLGRPHLGVLVASGNIDSMVNHYTAAKKPRRQDFYSPGGKTGKRPDRAVIVYANRIREAFGDIPLIIGGVEASLRRFAHYDYWSDSVRRSILVDSGADLLLYGMGERSVVELADALAHGTSAGEIRHIRGSCRLVSEESGLGQFVRLPSYEEAAADKRAYAESVRLQLEEQDPIRGRTLVQPHGQRLLVQNPPPLPLTRKEFDTAYELPYTRTYHPYYEKHGGVPAIEEVRFSVTSSRGCYGACSFCALTFHQGRIVQSRSQDSIVREVEAMTREPDFKGYVHDVGGPTANFRAPACDAQRKRGACADKQCLFPKPCPALKVDHSEYLSLLERLRKIKGVKKVFIRSGIRYDYLVYDEDDAFFRALCEHHVSGQLKVAPEHISPNVLRYMGKPGRDVYDRFVRKFERLNQSLGRKQYLVPYLMSSHPGSRLEDAIELAVYLKRNRLSPEQVQDFYPTPGTVSTCMFYTGLDPRTMEEVYVARSPEEKAMQRALLQSKNPKNYNLVRKALEQAGRRDLIGYGGDCLIPPHPPGAGGQQKQSNKESRYRGGKQHERNHSGRKSGIQTDQGRTARRGAVNEGKRNRAGAGGHHRGR